MVGAADVELVNGSREASRARETRRRRSSPAADAMPQAVAGSVTGDYGDGVEEVGSAVGRVDLLDRVLSRGVLDG